MADQIDTVATQRLRDGGNMITVAYRNSAGGLYYSTTGPLNRATPTYNRRQRVANDGTSPDTPPVTPPITPPVTPPTAPPGGGPWVTDPSHPNFGDPKYMAPPGHQDYIGAPDQVKHDYEQQQEEENRIQQEDEDSLKDFISSQPGAFRTVSAFNDALSSLMVGLVRGSVTGMVMGAINNQLNPESKVKFPTAEEQAAKRDKLFWILSIVLGVAFFLAASGLLLWGADKAVNG